MNRTALVRPRVDFGPEHVEEFRSAMANLSAGVSVVTALGESGPHGTTVTALMSLSARPPLAAVALDSDSSLLSLLDIGDRVGVNILASHQVSLASRFARKSSDKFDAISWHMDTGRPRLDGIHAWIASTVEQFIVAGDHILVMISVETADDFANEPLTYWRRSFGTHVDV